MRLAGVTVVERILMDAGRRGCPSATVRGLAADLPDLRAVPIPVHIIGPDAPLPAGAEVVAGDEYLGVRIATEESRAAVEAALLQMCPRAFDGPGDRHVLRHVSPALTRVLARLDVASEHATWITLGVGLLAVILLGSGATALGGLALALHVALDAADDELAALRGDDTERRRIAASVGADAVDVLVVAALGAGLGGGWATLGFLMAIAWGGARVIVHLSVRAAGRPWRPETFRWWFEEDVPPDAQVWLAAARGRDTYVLALAAPCVVTLGGLAFALGCLLAVGNAAVTGAHTAIAGAPW